MMPVPLIVWGGVALGALFLGARAADEVGDAAKESANLAKWAAVGGGLYVGYRALQASGALK